MKKVDKLTRLLDYMEENIDLNHVKNIEQLQYDSINFKEIDRLPLTIRTKPEGFKQLPLDESYYNPEKMLFNELLCSTVHSSYNSVRIKDDCPLMIRPNYGVGIIASMFGCKSLIFNNQMPWVEPINIEAAKKTFSKGIPDIKSALGKRVIDTYQYYHDRLKSYPKCYKAIHITQPDLQGPFDILHLIIGEEAFFLPYDEPEILKDMLRVISQTYVAFRKEVDPLLTDRLNDSVFAHGFCCGGKVLIKADTPTALLSPEMFSRYEVVYDKYILDSFESLGGGSYHYCGAPKPWHNKLICKKNLRCINYGNPEMHELEKTYSWAKKNRIAIVGWENPNGYDDLRNTIKYADRGGPVKTGLTIMCISENTKNGIEIIKRHREMAM